MYWDYILDFIAVIISSFALWVSIRESRKHRNESLTVKVYVKRKKIDIGQRGKTGENILTESDIIEVEVINQHPEISSEVVFCILQTKTKTGLLSQTVQTKKVKQVIPPKRGHEELHFLLQPVLERNLKGKIKIRSVINTSSGKTFYSKWIRINTNFYRKSQQTANANMNTEY